MVQFTIRTGTVPVLLTETHSHDAIAAQAAGGERILQSRPLERDQWRS